MNILYLLVQLLDVSDLAVSDISIKSNGTKIPVDFAITDHVKEIGSKLTIDLPSKTSGKLVLSIVYRTSPKASGLQWLKPEQTRTKKHPYVYSQCQAIHARSIVPCQDTAAVKFTFNAEVTHSADLTALLGGVRLNSENGRTTYEQTVPIPAYLLAIAVGPLVSRKIGPMWVKKGRFSIEESTNKHFPYFSSKVWCEEEIVDACAEEFSETSQMLEAAEQICGPYEWKVYDVLVMPSNFPFGGMENPCLTFLTPT